MRNSKGFAYGYGIGKLLWIPVSILLWVGLIYMGVWWAGCKTEPLNLEMFDPNNPILETVVETTDPNVELTINWSDTLDIVCEVSVEGRYNRGERYVGWPCNDFWTRTMYDPNDRASLATCWLMDQCSKAKYEYVSDGPGCEDLWAKLMEGPDNLEKREALRWLADQCSKECE